VNFKATSLNPFASYRLIILPTIPLCTPSGLTMIKVRSLASAIAFENNEKNANTEQITIQRLQQQLQRRTILHAANFSFRPLYCYPHHHNGIDSCPMVEIRAQITYISVVISVAFY
jgi:hypothetical protein